MIKACASTIAEIRNQAQWRVAYSFLHRVVDVDGAVHEVAELGAARVPGIQG